MRVSRKKFWTAVTATLLTVFAFAGWLAWTNRDQKTDWPKTIDTWEKATDTLEHLTTSLAFIVAGVWAYLQFVRRREGRPRLELAVTSRTIALASKNHLLATVQLRNTGSCDVDISQRGTGLEVILLKPTAASGWKPPPVQDVFTNHQWIEPGELISDQLLFETPTREPLILKLQFFLYSKKHHVRWESTAIVPTLERSDGQRNGKGGKREPTKLAEGSEGRTRAESPRRKQL